MLILSDLDLTGKMVKCELSENWCLKVINAIQFQGPHHRPQKKIIDAITKNK